MNVIIYSKKQCGYCDKAKIKLQKHNPKIYMLDADYSREDFFKNSQMLRPFHKLLLMESMLAVIMN